MKRNILLVITTLFLVIFVAGCTRIKQSSLDFKTEYEGVNGKILRDDITYRELNIKEDNPYIKVTPKDIAKKIENKETFYLYVGDPLCPWCRSGIEKMIEVAKNYNVKEIYYIDFWDDNHVEILRDLYEVQTVDKKNKVVKTKEAADGYDTILDAVKDFAQDYTLTKDGKTYNVGVKRIFGGDHFYFENGICKKYVSLRSAKLAKSNDDLTEEVLKDQETKFSEFFAKENSCDEDHNC